MQNTQTSTNFIRQIFDSTITEIITLHENHNNPNIIFWLKDYFSPLTL